MGNKKYSLIKGTNVEVDSSNITGKLIKVNGIINQKTREQVNGTTIKSENINVNDVTVETGRLDFFGNLKQETRSGKNKFISLGNNTIAGITITENEDGTYNISGTAAANIEHTAFINVEKSDIKNGSTYILSSTKTLPTGLSSRVEKYTDSVWLGQFITSITSTIPTRTGVADTTDTTRFRFGIFISSGTTLNIQNVGFQLEEGTVATDYEQYGVSPSSDYPSQIRVVGDNVNLFDKNNANLLEVYIASASQLLVSQTGTKTLYIECFPNTTYSIQKLASRFVIACSNELPVANGIVTNIVNAGNTATEYTYTTDDTAKYLVVFYQATSDETEHKEMLDSIKIEKGTVVTSYTNYGNGGIDYKAIGKNLLNLNIVEEITKNGLTYSYKDGVFKINGTATALTNIWFDDLNIDLEIGNYVLSSNTSLQGKGAVVLKDEVGNLTQTNLNPPAKFEITSKTKAKQFLIQISSGATFSNQTIQIQLEKGTSNTSIEPYQENLATIELPEEQFLAKLGNYEDSIDNSGLLKKWIGKKVLNGTENIVYTANTGTRYAYRLDISDRMLGDNHYVCTHFKQKSNGAWDSDGIISVNKTDTLIYIFVSNISTVDDFKSWLAEQYEAGTPVEIYYVLKNYSTVELSETSQIKMNYLAKLPMYLPITNVYSEDTISPFFRLRYNYIPALPNPDEFSPISVVGDNINLLPITLKSQTINGVTITVNSDNSITFNGTASAYFVLNLFEGNQILPIGKYNYSLGNKNTGINFIGVENGSEVVYLASNVSNTYRNITLTEKKTLTLVKSAISSGTVFNNFTIYPKIEKGILPTCYTSYGLGGFNYKASNSNMFDANKGNFSHNGLTFTYNSDKSISIKGTTTGNINVGLSINNFPIAKAGKTYTKWVKVDGTINSNGTNVILAGRNSTGVNYYNDTWLVSNKISKFTRVANEDMLMNNINLFVSNSGAEFDCTLYIMFYEGESEKEYEPHKSQFTTIELPNGEFMAKIGDIHDYIDNTGVLHKYIKKIILTGTETFYYNSNYNYFIYGLSDIKNDNSNVLIKSTHFIGCKKSETTDSEAKIYTDNGSNLYFINTGYTTVDAFKSYLVEQYANGTPVEIYYVLATPYTMDLSDENYAKIQSVPMLIDYNNISLEPENNEFVLVYEGDEIEKSYDVTITDSGKLQPFGLTIDYNKTNLPLIAEADEASQIITGADGDVVLNTTYGPRMFEITAVTDDYLTAEEKEAKREEIREFLNAIKNKTAKLIIKPLNRTFEVKYSGVAEDNNLPKCVEFVIPLKSSSAYAISNETYSHIGSGDFDSNTVEPAGCKITITGPANVPNININGYDVIWNHILAEGQKLIIDSKKSTVTRVSSLGVKTNVMAYYSHQFPKIQKGVNFVEIISGIEDSQLKIEWNDLLL